MNARTFFVTGTDTEVGKTFATCALLHALRGRGLTVLGMKPVAAGSEWAGGRWVNEDAERLRIAGSFEPAPELLNPYCLKAAVAPHIAAAEEGVELRPAPILEALTWLSCTAHVADHAMITQLPCTGHMTDHALISHVIMHCSPGLSCIDHVTDLVLIMFGVTH